MLDKLYIDKIKLYQLCFRELPLFLENYLYFYFRELLRELLLFLLLFLFLLFFCMNFKIGLKALTSRPRYMLLRTFCNTDILKDINYAGINISINADFSKLETYQKNIMIRGLNKIRQYKDIVDDELLNVRQKQKDIEKLDFITNRDLAYDLQKGELEFLDFIDFILTPPLVNYWNPKNCQKLSNINFYWGLKASRIKKHKYDLIYDFIQKLKSKLKSQFGKFILYCLKASLGRFVYYNEVFRIEYNTLITIFGQLLFKMGHSVLKKSSYFSIIADNTILYNFCFVVLGSIVDKYEVSTDLIKIEISTTDTKKKPRIVLIDKHFCFGTKDLTNHQWPMLAPPSDWVNVDDKLHFGGYQCNTRGFYPGIHLKQNIGTAYIKNSVVSMLNNLQKVPYVVDQNELEKINNKPEYLIELLNLALPKKWGYKECLLEVKVVEGKSQLVLLPYTDTNLYKSGEANLYKDTFLITWKYLQALMIMMVIRNYRFYNAWFLDFRARAYTTGYPLNGQGDRFTRKIVKMDVCNPINLDASSQGLSILGMLVGDISMSILTNVFTEPTHLKNINVMWVKTPEKKDLYLEFSQKVAKILKEEVIPNKDILKKEVSKIKLKTKIKKSYNIEGKVTKFIPNWDHKPVDFEMMYKVFSHILSILMVDRGFMKLIIMCISYNESSFSRINKLIEAIKSEVMTLGFVGNYFQEIYYMSVFIERKFTKVFSSNCKTVEKLITIFNSKNMSKALVARHGFVTMDSEIINWNYTKLKVSKKRVRASSKTGVCSVDIKAPNIRGLVRSILANFVHSFDSVINYKVLKYFQEKQIYIISIHDCWVIDSTYKDELKKIYYKALLDTLIYSHNCPVKQFLLDNNVDIDSEEIISFLEEIQSNKNNIIEKINSEQLVMSPHILTSD